MTATPTIRRAVVADVPAMASLINGYAEYGLMLHRSLATLYERLRDYHVAAVDGRVVGVCGLTVVWGDLAEVCALAVARDQRGQGLGSRLVRACLDDALTLGIPRVMTLTYERAFFERLGFEVIDRQALPLKVWSECLRCPKNQACDEIAMVHVLAGVPAFDAPPPQTPAPNQYVVPITLSARSRG